MRRASKSRDTFIHVRGNYLTPGEKVEPELPVWFGGHNSTVADRMILAKWLVSNENPLTARVVVNRIWQQHFGRGIVETAEDFGARGSLPSHPALLDWLASEFREHGWSQKHIHRLIVTSATYRQSSQRSAEKLQLDPRNRWLSYFPRQRLSAEQLRDNALAISGLLSLRVGGPPVFPYQPHDSKSAIYSGNWPTSSGEDSYRRAIYTFWRRTAPYASFQNFDAPSRETCTVQRLPTNTALQALDLLNDTVYVEAARGLARRMMNGAADALDDRISLGMRLCVARFPTQPELQSLREFYTQTREGFFQRPSGSKGVAWRRLPEIVRRRGIRDVGQRALELGRNDLQAINAMQSDELSPALWTRRHLFRRCGVGLGWAALASLLPGSQSKASETNSLREPHHSPRAKSVIYLQMCGGPSQMDLFDPKPVLNQRHNEPAPEYLYKGKQFAFIDRCTKLLGSPFKFAKHGASGLTVSELLPHLAEVADELCVVRSMHTQEFNHAPAQMFLNSGSSLLGRPSMGSWVSYGLGSLAANLPTFVVLVPGIGVDAGKVLWNNGFLPSEYQGTQLRTSGDPVLFVGNPPGVNAERRRMSIDEINALNQMQLESNHDPEIFARIRSYELAFRMQQNGTGSNRLAARTAIDLGDVRCRHPVPTPLPPAACLPDGSWRRAFALCRSAIKGNRRTAFGTHTATSNRLRSKKDCPMSAVKLTGRRRR